MKKPGIDRASSYKPLHADFASPNPKYLKKPHNHDADYNYIQYRFDARSHRNIAVNHPKDETYNNKGDDYCNKWSHFDFICNICFKKHTNNYFFVLWLVNRMFQETIPFFAKSACTFVQSLHTISHFPKFSSAPRIA